MNDLTKIFFKWIEDEKLTIDHVANLLGKKTQTVYNWKSIGIPKGQMIACKAIMEAHNKPTHITRIGVVEVEPTKEQLSAWKNNGLVKGNEFTEFALGRLDALCEAIAKESQAELPDSSLIEFPFHGQMAAGQPAETQLHNETLAIGSHLDPSTHAIFEVSGDSGTPQFKDGERWIVKLTPDSRTAKKGVPAVFSDENGCYLKIYNGSDKPFSSVNPEHKDVHPGESLRLVGYPIEKV